MAATRLHQQLPQIQYCGRGSSLGASKHTHTQTYKQTKNWC